VYRAASPEFATPGDVAEARRLGLTTFVDLRRPDHPSDWRSGDPSATTIAVDLAGSITRPPEEVHAEELLVLLADAARTRVAAAVRAIVSLAEQSPPVVFHCHTGKDRTGLLAVVLLSLAGVEDRAILDDYVASNPGFEAMRRVLAAAAGDDFMSRAPAAVRGPVVRPAAEALLRFLEECGGTAAYLESGGLEPAEVERAASLLR
jgi:protein-tyrosine phosphatase